jgi:HTH-type transcriptional regulator/antitoxin HigA
MYKRGWFEDFGGTLAQAKRNASQLIEKFFLNANVSQDLMAMHKQMVRGGGVVNDRALTAWQIRAIHIANKQKLYQNYEPHKLTHDWFYELAKLSQYEDGPLLARDWLLESGIHFVVEPHLKHTHLDGAALRHPSGSPVVVVTLRYDRLDNFWFVLFHELAHIVLHFPLSNNTDFFDDTDIRSNDLEREADIYALNSLVPETSWDNCLSRFSLTTEMVLEEARQLQIHPSILAGRIRYEQQNFTILNDAIGYGEVSRQFEGLMH